MQQGNAQPTAACAMQSNDTLRHSDVTQQCAAHSGVRTAEQRNGAKRRNSSAFGSNKRNTQPTAACALQSNENRRHSDATKATRSPQRRARCRETKLPQHSDAPNAMRNPQRRTHCGATKLLDPWLPLDGTFVVLVILVKYVVVLVLFVYYVICHSVTLCYMSCCYPRKWVLLGNWLSTLYYWFYLLAT